MSTAAPIIVHLGDAKVSVPPEAAALAYVEQMLERTRPIEVLSARRNNALPLEYLAIGEYWTGQGGIFAGLARGRDGKPDYYLVAHKLPREKATCDGAAKRAAGIEVDGHRDFTPPDKEEGPILYANVPELYEKDEWYWTRTQAADGPGFAWIQSFSYGGQLWGRKSRGRLVCVVRRVPIR